MENQKSVSLESSGEGDIKWAIHSNGNLEAQGVKLKGYVEDEKAVD